METINKCLLNGGVTVSDYPIVTVTKESNSGIKQRSGKGEN